MQFASMIGLAAGTHIWIVGGVTDMRRGFTGLSGMMQTARQENPFSGQVFVFRGKRGDLIKLLSLRSMLPTMTVSTKRDQIVEFILSKFAAELLVMDL